MAAEDRDLAERVDRVADRADGLDGRGRGVLAGALQDAGDARLHPDDDEREVPEREHARRPG